MKFEMTTLLVGRSSGAGPLDAEVEVGADSGKAGRQFLGLGLRVRVSPELAGKFFTC